MRLKIIIFQIIGNCWGSQKQLYLQNLNYSLSYDSFRSNIKEENIIIKNNNNDILNIDNFNIYKKIKKINVLNFLFVKQNPAQ